MEGTMDIRKAMALIDTRVNEHYELRKKIDSSNTRRGLFEEVLNIINDEDMSIDEKMLNINLVLEVVYPKDYAEKISDDIYNLVYAKEKYKGNPKYTNELNIVESKLGTYKSSFYESYIREDSIYTESRNKFNNERNLIAEYQYILSAYKNKYIIPGSYIDVINNLLDEYKVEPKEKVRVFQMIHNHNIKVKYTEPKLSDTVYKIIDNTYAREPIDKFISSDKKAKLDNMASEYIHLLDDTDDIKSTIYNFPSHIDLGMNDLNYVYGVMINHYLDLMEDAKANIMDVDNFKDIELRKVIIAEYNEAHNKYIRVRRKHIYESKFFMDKLYDKEEKEEVTPEPIKENKIIFLNNSYGEPIILKDLKNIPEEKYNTLKELLTKANEETLGAKEVKALTGNNNYKGYYELKGFQVRVPFRKEKDKLLILGAGIKKRDVDRKLLDSIIKRDRNVTKEEFNTLVSESPEVLDELVRYLDDNKRRSNK